MIVVTGANGRLGRLVAKALHVMGASAGVVLGSRNPDQIGDLAELGFRTMRLDFADTEGMVSAFSGAGTVLMISTPGPIEQRMPLHRNAIAAARRAEVGHLVYTSRVNPVAESLYPFAPIHVFTEAEIVRSGLPATIVRNSEYVQNITWLIKAAALSGELILPGESGRVAYTDITDIAEILATIVTGGDHARKIYEINGPDALTRIEIAALIARAAGRRVEAFPITRDEYGAFMTQNGRPPFVVEMLKGFYEAIDAGEFARVWADAEQLLGRRPKSIKSNIEETLVNLT
ncbi:NmrA family NAD(P)-binding protein [Sphingobium sp. BS19]|uniref:NmrA family NAD(P)-binding protein n=1 Tax=Sphingobium sp. BS19 TaxID=3018973 RepID=UPI0022EFB59F|nr:NmrA family NAD(P)-binding protein [Sphingobium sp. BS19]GLJ00649.1 NAD(P)-dependent oxidoreductase [Sphingobium sp. BS19]